MAKLEVKKPGPGRQTTLGTADGHELGAGVHQGGGTTARRERERRQPSGSGR